MVGEGDDNVLMAGSHITESILLAQDYQKQKVNDFKDLTADVSVVSNMIGAKSRLQTDESALQVRQRAG